MNNLLQDLKFSLRMLSKSPTFTIIAVVTLMLGIGLNAATYSTVKTLLLDDLGGVDRPDRMLQIYRHWAGIEYGSNSVPHYQDVRDRSDDVFSDVASWFFTPLSVSGDGGNERVLGMIVSANFFQTYGAEPTGRAFLPGVEDQGPGAHPVAVIGHGYWLNEYGADPDALGRSIAINGLSYEIVGIAPPDFRGPIVGVDVPIYTPLMMEPQLRPGSERLEQRGNNNMTMVARMHDDVTIEQAQQSLDVIVAGLREEHPDHYENQLGTTIVRQSDVGLHPSMKQAQTGISLVIMLVVGGLLLIACVNVANLFLARARERRAEIETRLSLGASRRRLIRQLLTESLVFSLIAGVASLGLAYLATNLLSRMRPPMDGPFSFDFGLDANVLLFTMLVSLGAGLLFGLVPALSAARTDLTSHMRTRGAGSSKASRALVVVQMALSLVLLISSALFLRSLQGAMNIDPGFDQPKHLLTAAMDPSLQGYDPARSEAFFDRLVENLEARAEIASVGLTDTVPLGLSGSDRNVSIPGYEFAEGERKSLFYAVADENYLETMGIRLIEGRTFATSDNAESEPVIIVNQRFAERFWPGESALGKIVNTAGEDRQVIGVMETGKVRSLGEDATEFMVLPYRELLRSGMSIIARTHGPPDEALPVLRSVVAELDPNMPLFDVRTMEDHLGLALLPARVAGSVLGLFGFLGLGLAAVGIYGVMAYSVAQRKRELGIRVALGANRPTVIRQVLSEGMLLAIAGTVLGLLGGVAVARLVSGLLYNTSAFDPMAFLGVPLLLLAVAALAVYVPARRAARSDPMSVLRAE